MILMVLKQVFVADLSPFCVNFSRYIDLHQAHC